MRSDRRKPPTPGARRRQSRPKPPQAALDTEDDDRDADIGAPAEDKAGKPGG